MSPLVEAVRNRLVASGVPVSPSSVAAALRAEGGLLGDTEVLSMTRRLAADLSGAGPLEELMTSGVTHRKTQSLHTPIDQRICSHAPSAQQQGTAPPPPTPCEL